MECMHCKKQIEVNYGTEQTPLCKTCREEYYHKCECCGKLTHVRDLREVYDSGYCRSSVIYCSDCCANHAVWCGECGRWFTWDSVYSDDYGTVVCHGCYENSYATCCRCDRIMHVDNVVWLEETGEGVCEYCHERNRNRAIKNYSYKPNPVFHGKDSEVYFGVELEIGMCPGSLKEAAEAVRALSNGEDLFYLKSDSSIPGDGFELVTHPCTWEFHKNEFPWIDICLEAMHHGMRGHDVPDARCGLHVHVSRNALSEFRWLLLDMFVNINKEKFCKIARRTSNHYSQYTDFSGNYREFGRFSCSRYRALNFENCNTVEFRIFRSSLVNSTIKATLDVVKSLTEFILTQNVASVCSQKGWDNYTQYIKDNRTKYDKAFAYMKIYNIITD